MAVLEVLYTGDYRTESVHPSGKSKVTTQAHLQEGEVAEAYTPMQMLAYAAASCVMSTIGVVAHVHSFSIEGIRAIVEYEVTQKPLRLKSLTLKIDLRGHEYSPKEKKFLELATQDCPVIRSLSPEVEKKIELLFV